MTTVPDAGVKAPMHAISALEVKLMADVGLPDGPTPQTRTTTKMSKNIFIYKQKGEACIALLYSIHYLALFALDFCFPILLHDKKRGEAF
jgi:hypothetical protein